MAVDIDDVSCNGTRAASIIVDGCRLSKWRDFVDAFEQYFDGCYAGT